MQDAEPPNHFGYCRGDSDTVTFASVVSGWSTTCSLLIRMAIVFDVFKEFFGFVVTDGNN